MNLRAKRRAFTILEACTAGAMLTVALSLAFATIGALTRQQRSAEQRQRALVIAENALERATSEPWETLTSDGLKQLQADAHIEELLPGGRLQLDVEDQPGPPAGRRLDVALSWQPGSAKVRRQVRLTTWIYRPGGADD